jgi:hypothetical protein
MKKGKEIKKESEESDSIKSEHCDEQAAQPS